MAVSFKKLKDPKLGLTDIITFGKLKDCRVCDVAQDHYEYLIWAEKNGYVKFQAEAISLIQEQASFARWEIHQAEEVDPYKDDFYIPKSASFYDDDIPF